MRKPKDIHTEFDLNNDGKMDEQELLGESWVDTHPEKEALRFRRARAEDKLYDETEPYDLNADGKLDEQELLGLAYGAPEEPQTGMIGAGLAEDGSDFTEVEADLAEAGANLGEVGTDLAEVELGLAEAETEEDLEEICRAMLEE